MQLRQAIRKNWIADIEVSILQRHGVKPRMSPALMSDSSRGCKINLTASVIGKRRAEPILLHERQLEIERAFDAKC